MNFATAMIPETELDNYLGFCFEFRNTLQYYDMETDAKMYNAMFGNRPLWG